MPVLMSETRNQMLLHQAAELARRGHGCVEPNPMVGCIVLDNHGKVAGEQLGRKRRLSGGFAVFGAEVVV